jgi:hypothetical protein
MGASPTEVALSFLRSLFLHDRDISVELIGDHLPTSVEACQNRSFGSALRQQHEAMAFLSLSAAAICFAYFSASIKKGQRGPAGYIGPELAVL